MLEGTPGFSSPMERGSSKEQVPGSIRVGATGTPCTMKFSTGGWGTGYDVVGLGA